MARVLIGHKDVTPGGAVSDTITTVNRAVSETITVVNRDSVLMI